MSLLHRCLLLLVVLWLPLQSVTAVAMPLCRGGHAPASEHGTAAGHHAHGDQGGGGHEARAHPPGAEACDHCGLCHLACAAVLPLAAPPAAPERTHTLVSPDLWAPCARCLAPDFRPPIAAA